MESMSRLGWTATRRRTRGPVRRRADAAAARTLPRRADASDHVVPAAARAKLVAGPRRCLVAQHVFLVSLALDRRCVTEVSVHASPWADTSLEELPQTLDCRQLERHVPLSHSAWLLGCFDSPPSWPHRHPPTHLAHRTPSQAVLPCAPGQPAAAAVHPACAPGAVNRLGSNRACSRPATRQLPQRVQHGRSVLGGGATHPADAAPAHEAALAEAAAHTGRTDA